MTALLRLYPYTGDERYMKAADLALCLFAPMMERQPFAFSHMIEAADRYNQGPTEVAFVGTRSDPATARWLNQLGQLYVPNLALYLIDPQSPDALRPEALQGKHQIDGKLTAYVCRNRACSAPITAFEDVRQLLT